MISSDPDFPDDDDGESAAADVNAEANCPYCGEPVDVPVDPGGGPAQEYVEDCPVCCRPWRVTVRYDAEGKAIVRLAAEDS